MRIMFVALIVACQILVVPLAAQDPVWYLVGVARAAEARDGIGGSHRFLAGLGQQGARPEPSIARPILFGALLGAGSWLAGGLIGYEIADTENCAGDAFCGFGAFLVGAAIGGSSGLAVGMHLGNNRRGNFPLDWLTSVGLWGVGIGIVLAMDDGVSSGGQGAVLIAIPVTQFALTLAVERATGRSRAQRGGGSGLAVSPRPDGGLGLGLSLPLR